MWDPPQKGRVANVERLLQVLAILRSSEKPVSRGKIKSTVTEYAADLAAIPTEPGKARDKAAEALDKKLRLDLESLEALGFQIQDCHASGGESMFSLRPTPWRLPLALDDAETALLAWVLRAPATAGNLDTEDVDEAAAYGSLVGTLPRGLGLVHAALAGQRALVVDLHGNDKVVEPVQLAAYQGRWFLLVRFPGVAKVYGYRLDRLEVVALGDPLPMPPQRVDPLDVLDPTAWKENDAELVEIRCTTDDVDFVASWFPRAQREKREGEVALTFSCTHRAALLDRVIGLAGSARLVSPAAAVDALRQRLTPFTTGAA